MNPVWLDLLAITTLGALALLSDMAQERKRKRAEALQLLDSFKRWRLEHDAQHPRCTECWAGKTLETVNGSLLFKDCGTCQGHGRV